MKITTFAARGMKAALAGAVALGLGMSAGVAEAETLKLQASSKAGDWAHRFMTDNWGPKLGQMTGGAVKVDVARELRLVGRVLAQRHYATAVERVGGIDALTLGVSNRPCLAFKRSMLWSDAAV